jgi:hypothetical protein
MNPLSAPGETSESTGASVVPSISSSPNDCRQQVDSGVSLLRHISDASIETGGDPDAVISPDSSKSIGRSPAAAASPLPAPGEPDSASSLLGGVTLPESYVSRQGGYIPPAHVIRSQEALYARVFDGETANNKRRIKRYLACLRAGAFQASDAGRIVDMSFDEGLRYFETVTAAVGKTSKRVFCVELGGAPTTTDTMTTGGSAMPRRDVLSTCQCGYIPLPNAWSNWQG